MRNLYIDFDGVILDTLPPVYKLAKQLNLDYKTQTKEMSKLFSKIDWEELIDDSVALNDSVNAIKNHPLIPKDIFVHGLIMCPETGKLEVVINGYKN